MHATICWKWVIGTKNVGIRSNKLEAWRVCLRQSSAADWMLEWYHSKSSMATNKSLTRVGSDICPAERTVQPYWAATSCSFTWVHCSLFWKNLVNDSSFWPSTVNCPTTWRILARWMRTKEACGGLSRIVSDHGQSSAEWNLEQR